MDCVKTQGSSKQQLTAVAAKSSTTCNKYMGDTDTSGRPHGQGVLHQCAANDVNDREESHLDESETEGTENDREDGRYDADTSKYRFVTGICECCKQPYTKFEGSFQHGEMHGKGILTFPDGAQQVGTWVMGMLKGLALYQQMNVTCPPDVDALDGEEDGEEDKKENEDEEDEDEEDEDEEDEDEEDDDEEEEDICFRLNTYDSEGECTGPGLECNFQGEIVFIGNYRQAQRSGIGSAFFCSRSPDIRAKYLAPSNKGSNTSEPTASLLSQEPMDKLRLLESVLHKYFHEKFIRANFDYSDQKTVLSSWPLTFFGNRLPSLSRTNMSVSDGELQTLWDGEVPVEGSRATFFYPNGSSLDGFWRGPGLSDAIFRPVGSTSKTPSDLCVDTCSKTQVLYNYDPPTDTCISSNPTLQDPYESSSVMVQTSEVLPNGAAGEGLFARIDLPAGQIAAWYSGIKIPCTIVDNRPDWSLNDNVINFDEDTAIDVPPKWSLTKNYCASLGAVVCVDGHKANHVGNGRNNAEYDFCFHPRFGNIKCVRMIKPVISGEEITVDYSYIDEVPPWWPDASPKVKFKLHQEDEDQPPKKAQRVDETSLRFGRE